MTQDQEKDIVRASDEHEEEITTPDEDTKNGTGDNESDDELTPDEVEELLEDEDESEKKYRQQKSRAYKAEQKAKKLAQENKKLKEEVSKVEALQERLDKQAMIAKGFECEDEQKLIKEAAKGFGITVEEALADEVIVGRANKLREQRLAEQASITHTEDGGKSSDPVDLAVKKFKQTGEMPQGSSAEARQARKAIYEAQRKADLGL